MFKNIFKTVDAHDIASHQLQEAERLALEHEAAAEDHKAMAASSALQAQKYRDRAARLRSMSNHDVVRSPIEIRLGKMPVCGMEGVGA